MLGKVDLLGLNDFGQNPGLNPIWGAVIGGGVAGVSSMVAGHATAGTTVANNRELIGLGSGLAVAGVMYAMKSTRHAALGAAVGAFLASGLAYLEKTLLGTVQLPATTAQAAVNVAASGSTTPTVAAGTAGAFGIANIRALNGNGLGISNIRALNGLGMSTVQQVPHAAGAIPGVAGPQMGRAGGGPPVNLMGAMGAAQRQVSLMGGPPMHGIASAYGATLMGGGR